MKKLNLTGRKFGRLTVLSEENKRKHGHVLWKCLCECGVTTSVPTGSLNSGDTKSCGCLKIDTTKKLSMTHGQSKTSEYEIWKGMIKRCSNPNDDAYVNYGGRGIVVCERWINSFGDFFEDMGKRPSKDYSIERMNNNGNYEPNNCKWATRSEQSRNHRIFKTNTSGVNGVSFSAREGKYRVRISVNNKPIFIGRYLMIEQAITARMQAEQKYWGKHIPCNL